eukprot:ANDGO_07468.mRNA.1 hypothetical protein
MRPSADPERMAIPRISNPKRPESAPKEKKNVSANHASSVHNSDIGVAATSATANINSSSRRSSSSSSRKHRHAQSPPSSSSPKKKSSLRYMKQTSAGAAGQSSPETVDRFGTPSSASESESSEASSSSSVSTDRKLEKKKRASKLEISTEMLRQLVLSAKESLNSSASRKAAARNEAAAAESRSPRRGIISDSDSEDGKNEAYYNYNKTDYADQSKRQSSTGPNPHPLSASELNKSYSTVSGLPPRQPPLPSSSLSSSSSAAAAAAATTMILDSDIDLPRPEAIVDHADSFVKAVLFYTTEALRDQKYTGLSLGNNKTFQANLRSVFVGMQTERQSDREKFVRITEELRGEKDHAQLFVEKSLARERELEQQLLKVEREKQAVNEERDKGAREIAELKGKLDATQSHGSRSDSVMTMLQETHRSLLQSNEFLLHEIQTLKSRHEREILQWKRNYDEIRLLADIRTLPEMNPASPPRNNTAPPLPVPPSSSSHAYSHSQTSHS